MNNFYDNKGYNYRFISIFFGGITWGPVLTHVELLCKFATGILCGQPIHKAAYASSKSKGVQVAGLGELNVDGVSFSIYPRAQCLGQWAIHRAQL